MSVYRRFARSKKGMSTIFGGLFFVIIILMGFNVMLWGFIQYDAYNHVITSMGQRDQQAVSENLLPTNSAYPSGGPFNIYVNNLGGGAVSIATIYIWNTNNTGQCRPTPCIISPPPASPNFFTNGNIPPGAVGFVIHVQGINVGDGNSYRISLATARGREFNLYYPFRSNNPPPPGGGGTFVTNIGPLNIYFDFNSFNFTQGSQTSSQPAWCVPTGPNLVFYVKIANAATDGTVTLKKSTVIFPQPYSTSGNGGQFGPFYVVDSSTVNPNGIVAYNEGTNPYVLPAAGPNGPSAFKIIKFGATASAGATGNNLASSDFWLTFIGFNYLYKGNVQGQTIPFIALRSVGGWPGACSS